MQFERTVPKPVNGAETGLNNLFNKVIVDRDGVTEMNGQLSTGPENSMASGPNLSTVTLLSIVL